MILYEFEGKELLAKYDIPIPRGQLVSSGGDGVDIERPVVVKAQVLSGKRAKAGGIVKVKNDENITKAISSVLGKIINGECVGKVLVEESVDFQSEYYLSISYDTEVRGPVLTISKEGGTGVEGNKARKFPIDILTKETPEVEGVPDFGDLLPKLIRLFFEEDCSLLEINPLVFSDGVAMALDAKIKLDDDAFLKHRERDLAMRGVPGHLSTKNEKMAKKISEKDYRGTAGDTYFDLPGDIAVLASGGGASLMAMDAFIAAGGKPANYTEYSADPTREKVKKLAGVVLSKPGLNGLWVGGAVANFTDIYETLSGVLDALKEVKPKYPIVVRRGGPREKEAFDMLREEKYFDFHIYGDEISISESVRKIVELSKKYVAST